MSMASERIPSPATSFPGQMPLGRPDSELNVSVVFTGTRWTTAALKSAGALAANMGCRLTLLVLQIVPYPLALEQSPVSPLWNRKRFETLAEQSPVETSVRIYLCRDRETTLKELLKPHSIVFIGGPRRWWWPTPDDRLARSLRRAGHEVIYLGTE